MGQTITVPLDQVQTITVPLSALQPTAPAVVPPPTSDMLRSAGRPPVADDAAPSWFETHLRPALESGAHPQTLGELMSLILQPTDLTRGSAPLLAAKTAPVVDAARGPVSRGLVNGGEALIRTGETLQPHGPTAALVDVAMRGNPYEAAGVVAVPQALKILGRLVRSGGRRLAPAVEETGLNSRATGTGWGYRPPPPSGPPPSPGAPPVPPTAPPTAPPAAPAASGAMNAAEQLKASSSFSKLPTTAEVWADAPPTTAAGQQSAMQQLDAAAKAAKFTLRGDERAAGMELIRQGGDPADVIEAIYRIREIPSSWRSLPTNAEVDANKLFDKMGRKTVTPGPPPKARK